jgi:tRNA (guanine37-N1)-methyltransferase
MRIHILTLFPGMFDGVLTDSMIGKAQDKDIVSIHTVNFRDYANNKHMTVDDSPYGGGGGMVLKPEPIFNAIDSLSIDKNIKPRVILMCPQGERYTQSKAESLANEQELVFICGHYEGYDERIRQYLVTDEISIGDYILTGGEIAAMAIIDSVVRLLPGVLGNEMSAVSDSFSTGLLEHPHYTRPAVYRDWSVPDVLISGHHVNVSEWRHRESLRRTWQRRPDLLEQRDLSGKELQWLKEFREES